MTFEEQEFEFELAIAKAIPDVPHEGPPVKVALDDSDNHFRISFTGRDRNDLDQLVLLLDYALGPCGPQNTGDLFRFLKEFTRELTRAATT